MTMLLLILFTNTTTTIFLNHVYAHITGNRTQQWINTQNSVKIQFTYDPTEPLVEAPTELKFSVQNLQTGQHLKDLSARVTIIDGQRVFKSTNITVPNGDFSTKFTFPTEGAYQIILSVSSKNYAIALASFRVFVPFQPFGTFNLNSMNPLILPALVAGIIGTTLVITFLIIMKKEYRKRGI